MSRAELLAEIEGLPPDAFIPPPHAAAFLGSTPTVLHSWRQQQRGPPFYGSNQFIRYRLCDLAQWMAFRAGEIAENAETLASGSPAA
jgi:hypothetical protein